MPHVSRVCEFMPSRDDLDRWRIQTDFLVNDLVRIASISETVIHRLIDSQVFLPREAYRVFGAAPTGGRFRFTRSGLIRVFRKHHMARALLHIGEVPGCYAAYIGPDADACRRMLLAAPHEVVAPSDSFAFGQLLFRDRPGVVIVDFTGDSQTPEDYNALIGMCRMIRTTPGLDSAMRPTVLGFGIPSADAPVVDRAISTADDLYQVAVKLCGARLSI